MGVLLSVDLSPLVGAAGYVLRMLHSDEIRIWFI